MLWSYFQRPLWGGGKWQKFLDLDSDLEIQQKTIIYRTPKTKAKKTRGKKEKVHCSVVSRFICLEPIFDANFRVQ